MRAMGLRAGRRRRFVATSKSDRTHKHAENVLDRQFTWPSPNQAWVGDITFVATRCGWAYLAILVDLCTRAIVGWAVSSNCDEHLARRALAHKLICVPGEFFDVNPGKRRSHIPSRMRSYVRLSFGPDQASVREGLIRLRALVQEVAAGTTPGAHA